MIEKKFLVFAHDINRKNSATIIKTDIRVTRSYSVVSSLISAFMKFIMLSPAAGIPGDGSATREDHKVLKNNDNQMFGTERSIQDIDEINSSGGECSKGEALNELNGLKARQLDLVEFNSLHREELSVLCRFLNGVNVDSTFRRYVALQKIRRAIINEAKSDLLLNNNLVVDITSKLMEGKLESTEGKSTSEWTTLTRAQELQGGFAYYIQICEEENDCNQATVPHKIISRRQLNVFEHPSFYTVVVEIGGSSALTAFGKSSVPIGGYRYEAVETLSNPQQVYQLRPVSAVVDHIVITSLFVVFPFAHFENRYLEALGVGLGPTIWRGGSGEFGKEWNLRLLWGPPYFEGLLISFGLGLNWINIPSYVPVYSYIAVAKGSKPPDFRFDNVPQLIITIGVSLDLRVLGAAGGAIIDKFRSNTMAVPNKN